MTVPTPEFRPIPPTDHPRKLPPLPYARRTPCPQAHARAVCRICGAMPATATTIRRHQGIVVLLRWVSLRGPFCKTCGTALFRECTSKTLIQGWWSPLSLVFANPLTLLLNSFALRKINALAQPLPGWPGHQLTPGRPAIRRRSSLIAVLPALSWLWIVAGCAYDAITSS
jgi:hypothetical protein